MSRNEEFAAGPPQPGLSEQDRELLDYARDLKKPPYLHNSEIMDRFGFQTTTFYQRLNRIIDDPNAAAYDPHTVKRYQAVRDQGARAIGRSAQQ
jgi:hypothetical protein